MAQPPTKNGQRNPPQMPRNYAAQLGTLPPKSSSVSRKEPTGKKPAPVSDANQHDEVIRRAKSEGFDLKVDPRVGKASKSAPPPKKPLALHEIPQDALDEMPDEFTTSKAFAQPRIRENANGGRGAPTNRPQSIADLRAAADAKRRHDAAAFAPPQNEEMPYTRTTELPSGYHRVSLPSRGVPYDFKEIFVRPLNVDDLGAIAAANATKSQTAMIDAVANCVVQDVRDLTEPDFRFVMYWLRLNSFTRSPFSLTWTSRYGNQNTSIVSMPDVEIVELKMTEEEFAQWRAKGISIPTMRDTEAIEEIDMENPAIRFKAERAQYVYLPEAPTAGRSWFADRIEFMNSRGLAILEDIRDFANLITHGVQETLKVTDALFDPRVAPGHLTEAADRVEALMQNATDPNQITGFMELISDLRNEAKSIREKLDAGEQALPREEVIGFSINLMNFFPSI